MNTREENFVLVKKEQRYSTRNGGHYWLLVFLDPTTGELLETSCDPLYDNWKNWRDIIEDPRSPGIYRNLQVVDKRTRSGSRVISADTHPLLVERLTPDEIQLLLEAILSQIS